MAILNRSSPRLVSRISSRCPRLQSGCRCIRKPRTSSYTSCLSAKKKEKEGAGASRNEPTGGSDSSPFQLMPEGLLECGLGKRELLKPGFHY